MASHWNLPALPPSASASGHEVQARRQQQPKRQRTGDEGSDEEVAAIGADLMTLALATEATVRRTLQTTEVCYIVARDDPLVVAAKAAHQQYKKSVEGKKGDHSYGPPHIHIAKAILVELTGGEPPEGVAAAHATLKAWIERLSASPLYEVAIVLRQGFYSDTYDYPQREKMTRILNQAEAYLAIDGDVVSANVLIARLMEARRAVHKMGGPPPGPSERKVRLALKALLSNGRRK